MTPFEAYREYVAIKLHFNSKTYNYHNRSGHTRVNYNSFEKRTDQGFFKKLASKGLVEAKEILVSMFVYDPKSWIGDIVNLDKIESIHTSRKKVLQSLKYNFKNELDKINNSSGSIESALKSDNGQLPVLIKNYLHGEISIETVIILIDITRTMAYLDRKLVDNILWPDVKLRLVKYRPWFEYDRQVFKEIIKGNL